MTSIIPNTAYSPDNISRTYKVKWTEPEDARLLETVGKFGSNRWDFIATFIPGRTGRQCRERWMIRFAPDIKKEAWTHDEDQMLIQLQQKVGNHWSAISKYLHGRTPIMIKNRFKLLCRHQKIKEAICESSVKLNPCQQISIQSPAIPVQLDAFPMNLYQNKNINEGVVGTDVDVNNSKRNDFEEFDFSNEIFYGEAFVF